MDAYCFLILIFAISTTVAVMNIITTVMVMRTRGMTWGRLPILVWGVVLSVILSLTAFPSFIVSQTMVLMDRIFQTSFFLAASGGSNWLYEHLFWFMGHPEVYVIALPALAVAAEVSAVFSPKPLFGYPLLVAGLVRICYWFAKRVGKRLDPLLGRLHFWLFEIGFVGTFTALFYAGLQGEPRWSANVALPFATPNLIASLFAILIAASVFTFIYNVIHTLVRGERAVANEWGAKTLEWTVPTPAPLENFEALPPVTSFPYHYGSPLPESPVTPAADIASAVIEAPVQPQVEE